MNCRAIISREAEEQLVALCHHIADAASSDIAAGYTKASPAIARAWIPSFIATPNLPTSDLEGRI